MRIDEHVPSCYSLKPSVQLGDFGLQVLQSLHDVDGFVQEWLLRAVEESSVSQSHVVVPPRRDGCCCLLYMHGQRAVLCEGDHVQHNVVMVFELRNRHWLRL